MVSARQILGIAGALAAAWNPTSRSEPAGEWHEVSHSTTRAPILASLLECSPCSVRIRPLVRHRPTEPLEVFFDVHRAPVSHSTVRAMRGGPLSSFTLPTIQDHSNVGIVVEGSRQICVELLITTRNDVEKPWHRPAPHSPWTSLLRARRRLGARGSHSRGYYFAIPSLGVMSDAPTTSVNATDAPERIKVLMVPSSKFSFMSPVIC